ncbi:acyl-CoA synthetase short-chain family member 3, mitochondrial [Lampetra fluviatilis]
MIRAGCTAVAWFPRSPFQRCHLPAVSQLSLVHHHQLHLQQQHQQSRASSSSSSGSSSNYDAAFKSAKSEPERFWAEAAKGVTWTKGFDRVLDDSKSPYTRWFVDGQLNMCYNALDRHVEAGRGDQSAIIHDSPVTGIVQTITYRQALSEVSRLASVLVKNGVQKGDRVVIYMPMIPQAMFAMLACARIGAIHSLIFGGFASKELAVRINHAKPKMVLSASFGIEPGRQVAYKPLLEAALDIATHKPEKVLVYSRPGMARATLVPGRDMCWQEEVSAAKPHDCVPVSSDHPLYILYTSGTTGAPKGVVRPTGGHAVMLNWSMSSIYGLKPGEVWWAASDLGWVVGHSYICYGPLLHGNTTVLYEGKPVGTPDSGAFFRVISQHKVVSMFTSPTALRVINQHDPTASLGRQYDISRFRSMFVAGEICDKETLNWGKATFNVPLLDHWWQTETGSAITATCIGLGGSLYPPAGQCGKSVPGYDVKVVDSNNQESKRGNLGNIVVKLPLAPGCMATLWENNQKYEDTYFKSFPGYYDTMDAGKMDEDGYVYVMARVDDVINVAGHRLSSGAIEEAILQHSAVVDCAVVGLEDSVKGLVPFALCVLKSGVTKKHDELLREVVDLVRNSVGPVAAFRRAIFVQRLPRTRSGKVPRSTIAALVNRKPYTITSTIEEPLVFKELEEAMKNVK